MDRRLAYKKRLKARGLCVDCTHPATHGRVRCDRCNAANNAANNAARKRESASYWATESDELRAIVGNEEYEALFARRRRLRGQKQKSPSG
jgi:hypothetical protein